MRELNKDFDRGDYPSHWSKSQLIKKCFDKISKTGNYYVAQVYGDTSKGLTGEVGTIVISQANTFIVDSGEWHLSSFDQSLKQDWFAVDTNLEVRHIGTTFGANYDDIKPESMILNGDNRYFLTINDVTKVEKVRLETEFLDNRLTPLYNGQIFSAGEIISMMPLFRFN